jgi:hypothetical protein
MLQNRLKQNKLMRQGKKSKRKMNPREFDPALSAVRALAASRFCKALF